MEKLISVFMRKIITFILMLAAFCASSYAAEQDQPQMVKIADPFIELHTGPGIGYPVFHIMERHSTIEILYQRSSWYKVRAPKGKTGWVPQQQLGLVVGEAPSYLFIFHGGSYCTLPVSSHHPPSQPALVTNGWHKPPRMVPQDPP